MMAVMLRLAADSVAHLPVRLGPVVVPGPHRDVLGGLTLGAVSRSEDFVSGEEGTSTAGLATARYGQSDLPGIF